jgi:hypothetical protein
MENTKYTKCPICREMGIDEDRINCFFCGAEYCCTCGDFVETDEDQNCIDCRDKKIDSSLS